MKKILIVDDDHHVRICINAIFTKAGFVTIEAPDGVTAIGELLANRPDAVILDHDMPFMTGMDVLKEFKKIAPEVPVVMFSGSNSKNLNIEALSAGASDYISKPVEIESLVSAVQKAMGCTFC